MHRQVLETLNEGVVENRGHLLPAIISTDRTIANREFMKNRGHLLPAIISTDRTIAHREFMKPLEDAKDEYYDAEAVEMNEESDSEDNESFIGGVVDDYETSDSDDESSEDEDELRRRMHKMLTAWV